MKKNTIKVCPRFIDKIKKDGPHTKTRLLWVVLERAQTAGGPTVSSPSLENTFAYLSVFIFSTYLVRVPNLYFGSIQYSWGT